MRWTVVEPTLLISPSPNIPLRKHPPLFVFAHIHRRVRRRPMLFFDLQPT
jgi:hypothetical protein